MKKNYVLLFCLLSTTVMLAQPTVNSNWAPSGNFGSNIIITSNTASLSAGASGANITWNLTNWSSASSFSSIDTCSFSVNTSDYPGTSDLTIETSVTSSNYRFRKLTGSIYQDLGFDTRYTPGGDYDHYSLHTPVDLLHFPVNYNNQFITTGYYYRDWTYGSSSYSSHGSVFVLVSADGYGKLNTPAGSFLNVLRIHSQENYTDSVNVAFQTWNITSKSTDRYDWISPDKPGIILASTSTSNSINGTTHYNYYSNVSPAISTGVKEMTNAVTKMIIYPQPASNQSIAVITSTQSNPANLLLMDLQGNKLLDKVISLNAGSNNIPLDLKDFPNGMYVFTLYCEKTCISEHIIVLH